MKIVLDTNAIVADFHFNGPESRVLFSSLAPQGHQLLVPEVVVDEAVAKFGEEVFETVIRFNQSSAKLSRLLFRELNEWDELQTLYEAQRDYKEYLVRAIADVGGAILPYPDIDHKTTVGRVLERRRPFRERDSGYRDYLVWETVKKAKVGLRETIALISKDKRAFSDGKGNIHEDILQDWESVGHKKGFLALFGDVAEFNNTCIKGGLDSDLHVRDGLLRTGKHGKLDLQRILDERVHRAIDALAPLEESMEGVPVTHVLDNFRNHGISPVEVLDIPTVKRTHADELYIEVEAQMAGEVVADVQEPDLYYEGYFRKTYTYFDTIFRFRVVLTVKSGDGTPTSFRLEDPRFGRFTYQKPAAAVAPVS